MGTVDAAVALRSGEEQKMHRQSVISERLREAGRSELGDADVSRLGASANTTVASQARKIQGS